jgi:hypothetical protein
VVALTDFDDTVSTTVGDGTDPFATDFDTHAGHALAAIQAHGQVVGILSNRAAGQITERCARVGFAHAPYVVGTYGYELLSPMGTPRIDRLFSPHREAITRLLGVARRTLLRVCGAGDDDPPTIEATIETVQGPVYVEVKGASAEYPEGLAQEYNFNRIVPAIRTRVVAALERSIRLARAREDVGQMRALSQLWGDERMGDSAAPGRFSWALKPTLARGKAYGLVRVLRAIGAESGELGDRCLVVYAGDHRRQDGQVMWAGKALERLSRGQALFAGVWAYPGWDSPGAPDESDLRVDGVQGVADTLTALAATVAR